MYLSYRREGVLTAVSNMLRSVGFLIFLASTLVGQQGLHELLDSGISGCVHHCSDCTYNTTVLKVPIARVDGSPSERD